MHANSHINSQDSQGRTALMCAIAKKHPVNILRAILRFDPDLNMLNVRDAENNTVAMYAVRSQYDAKTVTMLTTIETVNAENNRNETIMTLAFKHNSAEQLFDALIDKFTNLKIEPILITAIDIGPETLVEKLLQTGVDVNFVASDGRTPLMCAAMTAHVKKIELILNALKTTYLTETKRRESISSPRGERLLLATDRHSPNGSSFDV